MRSGGAIAVVAALAAVAGCAQTPGPHPTSTPSPRPFVRSADAAFAERAAYLAQAWSGLDDRWLHGFVPRQSLTVQGPADVGAYKASVWSGRYELATMTTLPAEVPSGGVVAFDNGETMAVRVQTAAQAFDELTAPKDEPCPGCPMMTVTGAILGTVKIETSRGPATVPAWLFSVAELKGQIARVAVAPADVTATPAVTAPVGSSSLAPAGSLDVVEGTRIEFRASVGSCDTDARPQVWETDSVVVLGAVVSPRSSAGFCIAAGAGPDTPMSVTLSRPLGDRLVIDVLMGQPVPIGV